MSDYRESASEKEPTTAIAYGYALYKGEKGFELCWQMTKQKESEAQTLLRL